MLKCSLPLRIDLREQDLSQLFQTQEVTDFKVKELEMKYQENKNEIGQT